MHEYVTINATTLKKIVSAASVVSEKAVFIVNSRRIIVQTSNFITSINAELDVEDGIVKKERVVTLDLTELSQALSGVRRGERAVWMLDDRLRIIGKTKRDITLNVYNGTRLSIPEIDFDVEAYINDTILAKFVKNVASFTDRITFRVEDRKLVAIAYVDGVTVVSDLDACVYFYRKTTETSYPSYQLAKILKNRIPGSAAMGFSAYGPLRLSYEGHDVKFTYYLEPWR